MKQAETRNGVLERGVTLFLIDDDDIDVMDIKRCFRSQRINNPIVRACDGLDALEMLHSGQVPLPFIILLDLKMPRMGGLEFLDKIRQDPELKSSVIFVLTTSKNDQDMLHSYGKNIAGYLVKENSAEEFLRITSMLKGYWKIVHLPNH